MKTTFIAALLLTVIVCVLCPSCRNKKKAEENKAVFDRVAKAKNKQDGEYAAKEKSAAEKKATAENEEFLWGSALNEKSITGYQTYLAAYPNGAHVREANLFLQPLIAAKEAAEAPLRRRVITIILEEVYCKKISKLGYVPLSMMDYYILKNGGIKIEAYQENCSDGSNKNIWNHNSAGIVIPSERFRERERWNGGINHIELEFNDLNCTPAVFLTAHGTILSNHSRNKELTGEVLRLHENDICGFKQITLKTTDGFEFVYTIHVSIKDVCG